MKKKILVLKIKGKKTFEQIHNFLFYKLLMIFKQIHNYFFFWEKILKKKLELYPT